jgi:hypothetical protein
VRGAGLTTRRRFSVTIAAARIGNVDTNAMDVIVMKIERKHVRVRRRSLDR